MSDCSGAGTARTASSGAPDGGRLADAASADGCRDAPTAGGTAVLRPSRARRP
ncbi:hypothetical protein GN316_15520 [Xylophilus sp. Kf1]|nr:hypothetical protein [Xylophilus sp. Kf1]